MAKQAQFYILEKTTPKYGLSATESLACDLAAAAWRLGKRVLISCETEQQALNIDEALWQREPEEFVPHNLSGEVTRYAAPIEICWANKRNAQRRDLLINLQTQVPDFAGGFNQAVDFVPNDETLKIQARERYKQYRQQGWQLSTEQA
ncbi:DNA polymerase III subunit chi [Caviibacterium pharyngocola]|uniref:DNA polymerase III subunit chi n=1 Tax=Caviibacterium pharyngocola TaxID=28159 RepID=A0A2M8RTK3_9PAST|nr:DNA polymerase III subunit chi [Caviibacterium pharyngocola]PJG82218.1 DNA polymerase III subunit chi [Caviibacterium pharyngocola]